MEIRSLKIELSVCLCLRSVLKRFDLITRLGACEAAASIPAIAWEPLPQRRPLETLVQTTTQI